MANKNVFLDTNVLIDLLGDRQPFSSDAAKLFNYSLSGKIRIFISAVSYNNIYYIIRRSLSHNETIKLLNELTEMVDILDVTKAIIKKSMTSGFRDLEDAIQYHCALSNNKIDFIITRDRSGFKKSALPVLSPHEALSSIENSSL